MRKEKEIEEIKIEKIVEGNSITYHREDGEKAEYTSSTMTNESGEIKMVGWTVWYDEWHSRCSMMIEAEARYELRFQDNEKYYSIRTKRTRHLEPCGARTNRRYEKIRVESSINQLVEILKKRVGLTKDEKKYLKQSNQKESS